MSQGVFFVKFESNIRDFGDGLVFIKDGSVNGCDPHFLYQGAIPRESGSFTSQITVQPWRTGNTHVFGGQAHTFLRPKEQSTTSVGSSVCMAKRRMNQA